MNGFMEALKAWGPAGLMIIAFIDGIGLPNPGGPDYLLLFLAWKQPESAYLSAFLCLIGALSGTFGLFWIARKGGRKYLDAKASGPRAMKFRAWFQRYGLVTVFIPALVPMVPLPMKVFVLCAGALAVSPWTFLVVVAAGKVPRMFGLAYLGKSLGENSTQWLKDHRWHFAVGAVVLAVLLFLLVKLADRLHVRRNPAMEV
ncbi:MAG TPA: VTT domain-containing protein [Paludibaculum sp.]|jgi:undecaprenyl-diphosphatase